jgi:cytochrome oxidase assembly protein ShyY1
MTTLRRHPVFLWLFAIAAFALFARLGAWQLDRRHEKQVMLDEVAAVLADRTAQPLAARALDPLPAERGQVARQYAWVEGQGTFLDRPAVLLDNQQRDGRVGVRAYRAFLPEGASTPVLVELGWRALPGDRAMPATPRPEGVVRLAGLLLPPPSPGLAASVVAPQADGTLLATGLRLPEVAAAMGLPALAPRVLRPDPALAIGYTRDLDILPNTLPPEKHLGYAVQWFGLAAAVLVTAFLLAWRARRRRPNPRHDTTP